MGIYTALEVNLKLKYDDFVARHLADALFNFKEDEADKCDDHTYPEPGKGQPPGYYLLYRMFWMDGGAAFHRLSRSMKVIIEDDPKDTLNSKSYILLHIFSSYKGITHWQLMDWLKPHIVAGYVRWQIEGHEEQREDFGPLGDGLDQLEAEARKVISEADPFLGNSHAKMVEAQAILDTITVARNR